MIWTIDPGHRWGVATGTDTFETLHASTGDMGAYLATLPRPDVVVVEDPIQQVIGIRGHAGQVAQIRRYRDQRDAVIRLWGLDVVRDVPVLTWQAIHKNYTAKCPKQKSFDAMAGAGVDVALLMACRCGAALDKERVDVGAMWVWAKKAGLT